MLIGRTARTLGALLVGVVALTAASIAPTKEPNQAIHVSEEGHWDPRAMWDNLGVDEDTQLALIAVIEAGGVQTPIIQTQGR